jgi:THO complex subunit 2
MIWSVDAALDEVLSDAKLSLSSGDSVPAAAVEKAKVAKQNAERDKEGLQALVKRLLVCAHIIPRSLSLSNA